ncbi:unnamed protein product [Pedinophyceae sp. YPF-701]|nr:unnamed protein product [Pedinophyceae sp. YPF-701]
MAYLRDSDDEEYVSMGSSEDESESEEGEGLAGDGKKGRMPIYNVEAIHEALEDMSWTEDQPWIESMAVTSEDPTEIRDVEDDIERELAFYTQALSAALRGIQGLTAAAAPWRRPLDYYAEMVKSDEHMAKVKQQMLLEQKAVQEMEERRKAREAKKFARELQSEKIKERAQQRKHEVAAVSKWRKQRKQSGFAPGEDFDPDAVMAKPGKGAPAPKRAGQRFDPSASKVSAKRQSRNAKYGFGGKKRVQKQNDAKSAADMSSFKPSVRGGVKKGGKGKGGKGAQGGNRPGKAARAKARARR